MTNVLRIDYYELCMAPSGDRSVCGQHTKVIVDGEPLCSRHRRPTASRIQLLERLHYLGFSFAVSVRPKRLGLGPNGSWSEGAWKWMLVHETGYLLPGLELGSQWPVGQLVKCDNLSVYERYGYSVLPCASCTISGFKTPCRREPLSERDDGCGECCRLDDFVWDPYRLENDGPVMVCGAHGMLAPGWVYEANGATRSDYATFFPNG